MRFQITESSPRVFDYTERLGLGIILIRVYLTSPTSPRVAAWVTTPEGDQFPVSVHFSDILWVIRDAAERLGSPPHHPLVN